MASEMKGAFRGANEPWLLIWNRKIPPWYYYYHITQLQSCTISIYVYDKRLVTSLIEHEDRVTLPIVCKMIDNEPLITSFQWVFENLKERKRERENRKPQGMGKKVVYRWNNKGEERKREWRKVTALSRGRRTQHGKPISRGTPPPCH